MPAARPGLLPALYAGAFLVYASANAPVPIVTELRGRVGMGPGGAAIFLIPFAAGFGAGCVAWLLAARRASPRVALPVALGAGAAASALFLATDSAAVAVTSRAALGAAVAGYPAVAQAVVSRVAEPARRGRLIGGFIAAVVAGSFAGQALVGAGADLLSPAAALLGVCVAAPLCLAAVLARIAPGRALGPHRAVDAGAPAGGLWRRQAPVLGVAALTFGAYWLLMSELPQALRGERFHLTAAQAGAVSALGLLGVASALLAGRWSDASGPRPPVRACLVLGVAGIAATLPAGAPLWVFAAGEVLVLAAYWGYLPAASAEVSLRSRPDERQGALMAFYVAMWGGAAVAPAASALMGWTGCALLALGAWLLALVPAGGFTRRAGGGATAPRATRRRPPPQPESSEARMTNASRIHN